MSLKNLKIRYYRGVTLIELLVVITIMMSLLTLVSPLAINTIDKAEAQREYLSFCNILRRLSVQAFANGSGVNVTLDQNTLSASMEYFNLASEQQSHVEETLILERQFEFLIFSGTKLKFNKNGMPNIRSISFNQRNKIRQIDLITLLEY